MQQLSFSLEHQKIVLCQALTLGENDFTWICQQLSKHGLTLLETSQGADRLQSRFSWQQAEFLLLFEGLCAAVWIESVNNDSRQIQELYRHFSVKC